MNVKRLYIKGIIMEENPTAIKEHEYKISCSLQMMVKILNEFRDAGSKMLNISDPIAPFIIDSHREKTKELIVIALYGTEEESLKIYNFLMKIVEERERNGRMSKPK